MEGPAVRRLLLGNVFRQSEAQWRDLRFSRPFLGMSFDRRNHRPTHSKSRSCSLFFDGATADLSTALRSVEKHFQEGAVEPQVPPLRCAPVGMTRGRDGGSREREPFFISLGGPQAHDPSGRDHKEDGGYDPEQRFRAEQPQWRDLRFLLSHALNFPNQENIRKRSHQGQGGNPDERKRKVTSPDEKANCQGNNNSG